MSESRLADGVIEMTSYYGQELKGLLYLYALSQSEGKVPNDCLGKYGRTLVELGAALIARESR